MKYRNTLRVAVACTLINNCFSSTTLAFAADDDVDKTIPTIIVTATRTANTADETMAPVTIITREDINRLQVNSIAEVLSLTPGIDMYSSGGYGSITSLHIRGTNSDHILTLIDGIRVGSATSGTMAFEYLPISQIERIEIVRGPRSSLYGADSIGGVIQIFTRKGTTKQSAMIEAGYGTENSSKINAHYSNGNKDTSYQLGLSFFNTDGYNFVGNNNGEKHAYDNASISLSGSHKISDKLDLSILFLRSQGNSEFDGSYVNNTDYVEQVVGGQVNMQVNDIWDMSFKLGQNQSNSDNNLKKVKKSQFDTTSDSFSWQNNIEVLDNSLLTLGADYENDKVKSSTQFDQSSRDNKAIFAQYQLFEKAFDFTASARHDDNESYSKHNTGNLSLAVPIIQSIKLTAAYGTAFKAPTFNDLYYPLESYPAYTPGGATSSYSGNPNLEPETSKSFDLGLKGNWQNQQWSINYFNTKIDNLIEYISELNTATNNYDGTMKNISNAKINGIELTYQILVNNWNIQSNYSWVDPKNNDTNKLLPNRSQHLFNLQMDTRSGQFTYGASIQAASKRYIDTSEAYKLAGYTTLNLRLNYQINKQWAIMGKLDNVFDKEYAKKARFALSQKYLAPGRSAFVSLQYKPFE
ncbi:MAG: TonB-dependent receptor [Pseudomonadota bacterium]